MTKVSSRVLDDSLSSCQRHSTKKNTAANVNLQLANRNEYLRKSLLAGVSAVSFILSHSPSIPLARTRSRWNHKISCASATGRAQLLRLVSSECYYYHRIPDGCERDTYASTANARESCSCRRRGLL